MEGAAGGGRGAFSQAQVAELVAQVQLRTEPV
jgi:hypothetical protein